jgi:hypothetical protein
MSTSNMVAENKMETDKTSLPTFDAKNVVTWSKKMKIYLMKKKRNHLGLEPHGLVRPPNNATIEIKEVYRKALEAWQERKDTCVSEIYSAVEGNTDALEIADQYMLEKEILPVNDPNKETLASELLTRLINRFRGEIEDEVSKLSSQFTQFLMLPGEKVSTGIDRLNGIVQKLTQHGYAPTAEAKLAKLKSSLQIPALNTLWISIALMNNPSYADVVRTCKRYDTAMDQMDNLRGEVHFTSSSEKVVCSYPKCGKTGHTQAQCFLKKRDQKAAAFKRAGKSKGKEKHGDKKSDSGKQVPGSNSFTGCHCCGESDHRAFECPQRDEGRGKGAKKKTRFEATSETKSTRDKEKTKRQKTGWNKFVRHDDRGTDEDSDDDGVNMLQEERDISEGTFMSEENDVVFLDSCASKRLFIVRDQSFLQNFVYSAGSIQTTRADAQLASLGTGSYGDWKDIRVCNGAVKNICSGGILRDMGYGLSLLRVPRVVRLLDEEAVLIASYAENGMPYVSLVDLLDLPNLNVSDNTGESSEEVHFSDNMDADPVDLLHDRCGHFSKVKLLEAHRHMLFTGSGLSRRHLSKKSWRYVKRHLCKSCARAKITRTSFNASEPDEPQATKFLEKVTADISVYLNCPSRQGYKYVLVFTDVATKMIWEYPLKERTGEDVLRCVKHWVEEQLVTYPGDHQLLHYHADGGAELIDQKIKNYLLGKFGTRVTWSSTDTPEQNAISERKFRTLGEMTLAMLTDSGLPKSFWWDAYVTACHITRLMPTRTYRGWMSPTECVPGGHTPSLSRLRRWGCKAYVLIPKADRRKDWEDKSMIGHFIGYSKNKKGYMIMCGDTVITSVHVLFDESIPERSADYFKELDEAIVKVDSEERSVNDFNWLVGKYHMEDGLLYKTTRVVVRKGLIVGYRSLITDGKTMIEDKTPIHIADLQSMTEELAQRLHKKSDPHDGEISVDDSQRAVKGVTHPRAEPESSSGQSMSTSDVPESRQSMSTSGRRERTQRSLTNISTLGEAHLVDVDEMIPFLGEADAIWLSDDATYREPETYKESRECPDKDEWRRARSLERKALQEREVMEVVETPDGVKPIKSRYVYKRKYNKDGSVKKYKARLVALGYGQVPGVDVFNTFAPVVKGITVRLLLALALIFSMHVHQLDVTNAFCYANIEGDVYMQPPEDFNLPRGHCFKLRKSLYGLRSSPRSWWKHLNKFIKSLHFQPCVLEPCLYHRYYKGELMLLTIYVDDIIIACANIDHVKEVKKQFCTKFDMTDMGELEHFLNVRVTRTRGTLKLDQSVYTQKVLDKFADFLGPRGKTKYYPLPADAADQLAQQDSDLTVEQQQYLDNFPYRSLIGAALYLSMNTRSDISYAVGVLSRHSSKPTLASCKLLVHMWQYLRGTVDKSLTFSGRSLDMHIFTDSDWAGDVLTRRSTTGYVVFAAGGPIAWQSKLQTTVSTSSMQAEYQALYAGMQELVWLRGVMAELGLPFDEPTPFFVDSQSAEDLALNPVYHKRSKHIEIKYHWVREHVDPEGELRTAHLIHVRTGDQSADLYTKALTGAPFETHRERNLGEKRRASVEVAEDNRRKRRR